MLSLLTSLYLLSYIDRQMLALLLPAVKADLMLSDTKLGFLTGVAFSLFYAIVGIPVARLADRFDRLKILVVMVVSWSAFTSACGFAQNFLQLTAARFGVGSGEAGIVPTSLSILAEYFPENERGTPSAIFMLAIPLGVLIGFPLAGAISADFGWRGAFFVLGLPGLVLAVVVSATLRIPSRNNPRKPDGGKASPSFLEVSQYVWKCPSFRNQILGGAAITFAYSAALQWTPSFLTRSFGMETKEIGIWLGLSAGLLGACGTFLGGFLVDRLGRRDPRWYMWVPGCSALVLIPLVPLAYLVSDKWLCLVALSGPMLFLPAFLGPYAALVQELSGPTMRATAVAISTLSLNLIGQVCGPQVTGILSDAFRPQFGEESLRYALIVTLLLGSLWASFHWARGAKTLRTDLVDRKSKWPDATTLLPVQL